MKIRKESFLHSGLQLTDFLLRYLSARRPFIQRDIGQKLPLFLKEMSLINSSLLKSLVLYSEILIKTYINSG